MNLENVRRLTIAISSWAIVVVGTAHAQDGVNLAWDDCVGSGNESQTKTVACTNNGTFNLLCSFASPVDIPALAAVDAYMDIRSQSAISPWWSETGRFSIDVNNATGGACGELWPQAPTGFAPIITPIAPNRIRVRITWVFAPGQEQPVVANTEYYSHTLQLRFRPGTAENPGCATPACFVMADLVLLAYGEPDIHVPFPLVNNAVGWQGGSPWSCVFFSPTQQSSWGQIKALYR